MSMRAVASWVFAAHVDTQTRTALRTADRHHMAAGDRSSQRAVDLRRPTYAGFRTSAQASQTREAASHRDGSLGSSTMVSQHEQDCVYDEHPLDNSADHDCGWRCCHAPPQVIDAV